MSQEEMLARLREQCTVLDAGLDERSRRLWAVTEAKALGHGGQTLVATATGRARRTLYQGLRELKHLADGHRTATQRVRQLAAELQRQGHKVGRQKVAALLAALTSSLHGNWKTRAGTAQPDRHAPCAHINAQVAAFHKRGQPVVSVET